MEPHIYKSMIEIQRTHWWFRGRRRFLDSWVRIHARAPRDARILEVGAGTGSNLDTLKSFGRVTALEPDSFAFEHISGRRDITAVQGALPSRASDRLRDFDLVVAMDVLEHIEDDSGALRSMHRMLKRGGTIILTVPAFRFLWSAHDENLHHFRRYRAPELTREMERAGFRIVHASYFNFILFPAALAIRLFGRFVSHIASAGGGKVYPPLNSMLARVFGAEVIVSRFLKFPFGLSVVCIGVKMADEDCE